jgi:hypothetical protein
MRDVDAGRNFIARRRRPRTRVIRQFSLITRAATPAATSGSATGRGTLPRRSGSSSFLAGVVAQLDSISVGHPIERSPVDAEDLGRASPVTANGAKNVFEVAALHLLE